MGDRFATIADSRLHVERGEVNQGMIGYKKTLKWTLRIDGGCCSRSFRDGR